MTATTTIIPTQKQNVGELLGSVWRVVKSHPLLFFAIPLVTSWLSGQAVLNLAPLGFSALLLSFLLTFFVGIALNFAQLIVVRSYETGEDVSLNRIFEKRRAGFVNFIGVQWSVLWRICVGAIAFIVPGVYLLFKYRFASMAAVFENSEGYQALEDGASHWQGQRFRLATLIALPILTVFIIYLFFGFASGGATATAQAGPVNESLIATLSWVSTCVTILVPTWDTIVYLSYRQPEAF